MRALSCIAFAFVLSASSASAAPPIREVLRTGAMTNPERNSTKSANTTTFVTIPRAGGGSVRAIVKGAGGAPEREAAAYDLSESLGLHFVPPTALRNVDGQRSSVQLVVPGAMDANKALAKDPRATLDRASAEKLRVFDYVIGNVDRHGGNVLLAEREGRYFPVAIDNGMSLPKGPTNGRFYWPYSLTKDQSGPLLASTKGFIRALDARKVARVLRAAGIEREAALHAARRVEHVKEDASFLELPEKRPSLLTHPVLAVMRSVVVRHSGVDATFLPSVGTAGRSETQSLSPAAERRAQAAVAEVYGRR